jgi:hypothetical protein
MDNVQDEIDNVYDSFYEDSEHVFDKFPKYHTKILFEDITPQ